MSLSLAWSVLSILIISETSHTLFCSPTFLLSCGIPHQCSFLFPCAITLTDNSLQCPLHSLSFSLPWISFAFLCVVSHVPLSHRAQGPLNNIDSKHKVENFLEVLLVPYILNQCILLVNPGIIRNLLHTARFPLEKHDFLVHYHYFLFGFV